MKRLGTTRVIAHRGASGYLPEHTLAAKSLGYGLGADFLEQDLVATRDGALVVLHDLYLEDVSDVASLFPDRRSPDGHYYVIDFELEEVRELSLRERRKPGSDALLRNDRFREVLDGFRVVTLDDELRLVRGLNATTGRAVGVYPELKGPRWHLDHGIDMATLLLDALARFGFDSPDTVFIQSFDSAELERLRFDLEVELPLIQLVDGEGARSLAESAAALERCRRYAAGVGLPYGTLLDAGKGGLAPSRLFEQLAAAELRVHPYTFRRDEPAAPAASFEALLAYFIHELGVDALFCDHPDIAVSVRDHGAR